MAHDLVIRGGTVVDGTGAPARLADVAVDGDRITVVGEVDAGGARAVIGTIWPVRDSEAATLAEHFYVHLARGATVAASLAGAQRELSIAGAPPAAWAGFVLVGDGSATLAPQPAATTAASGGSVWTVILSCGLALAVVVWLRKNSA